ncbi:hypothetical protein Tco_0058512 [Tanacetum coccineum]
MPSSKHLVNNVGSMMPLENLFCKRNVDSSSYHALSACFNPYNAFLSLCQNQLYDLELKRVMQDQLGHGKEKCQVSLANWMQFGWDFPQEVKIRDRLNNLMQTIEPYEKTITKSCRRQLQLADASGIHMLQNEEIFAGLQNIGSKSGGWDQFGSNIATALICQPQPSAAPTPTHHVPTPSSSHVQITQSQSPPPPITATPPTQPPPSLTQPVQPPPTITQSSLTTPQPSSVQPTFTTPPIQPVETTSSPPMFTIPDTQPTLPPSPQVPSPSYHDTEGPSFEPSYHLSPPPSHEPENQAFRSSEENEQLRNLMDYLIEKVKKLENKLRKKRKSKEAKDAEGQDQEVPFETDQGDTFATPEKSKGSGEAQEEQISPSTLEAAQILTNVASEGFKGSQAPLGSKIYKRKPKSTKTPTKILHFEEPDSAQVNTAQVNTAKLNPDSTPSAQVNTDQNILQKASTRRKGANIMKDYSKALYERYKKQDQNFVAIGTEEDERAIKKMNEKAIHKEEEKKDDSVHEEVKEEEGSKKRKLGTRRKLKAKRRKHASGLTREDDDLKISLHIAPDEKSD